MQADLESAFVLHARGYRESSLLVELFSQHHGRVGAVARGFARRGGIEPFQRLLVSWRSRRGELVTLTHAEGAGPSRRAGATATLCGFYLNELLLHALQRNDPHPALFDHYAHTLDVLSVEGIDTELPLRWFEKRLLEEIGYAVSLEQDVDDRPIEPARRYRFLPGHGAIRDDGDASPREAVPVAGATLLALANQSGLDEAGRQEAKRLMRGLLRAYLGDRQVVARAWFEEF